MLASPSQWIAIGEQLGLHAWPLFLGLLLLATCTTGGITAWLAHGGPAPSDTSQPVRSGFLQRLGPRVVGSFALLLFTAAVFSGIARLLGDGGTLQLADEALSRTVATRAPAAALAAFGWLTHFGEPLVLTVLGVAVAGLLWRSAHRGLALGWVAAVGGNAVLNPLLKQVFERARPLHLDIATPAQGFSFPSGHSSGAMVTYGMLAYLAWRLLPPRWHVAAAMGATAVILTTAASRVFLRVHFASDVVAGLCSGAAWLVLCIASIAFARRRGERRAAA
ncbi:hypothetical protein RD110_20245 [Rhodoferax koreense]|uniref:Phosphatidic acid phosphatase type 2/haloperoxidase domain-containing protein n=1 Tax=Rhodoferax koreensis TaxID=1842727 RepID=A0A1P8JZS5_9BURK|nr:phosphatase PAP2 family protein [Rhodoferax koreense]APW39256.1 hypothetical protein RD110_20245 [Rhodoferax koreense]